jgi:hypothetical protein
MGLCILNIVILISRHRNLKVSTWIIVIRFLLISSISVFILDSIPYLFIDIFDVPLFNIILSNIFVLLLGVSSAIYEYVIIEVNMNSRKKITMKKEVNL